MTHNLDNALRGLKDARDAIFAQTSLLHENDVQNEIDQMDKLKVIQGLISKAESKIKEYDV